MSRRSEDDGEPRGAKERLGFGCPTASRRAPQIVLLIALAFALDVMAAVGLSYVAGFDTVRAALLRFSPVWVVPIAAGIALSFVGYFFAYRELYRARQGPVVPRGQLIAIVLAGFGGFFAHGGAVMDRYALEGAGTDEQDASVRVNALAGLEHGALGIIGTVAGIVAILLARAHPPPDFQYPWAIIPLPGMLAAFWLAHRYRTRFRAGKGLRGHVRNFLESIDLIRHTFRHPGDHLGGPLGMTVFWLAELGAAWSALAAFGFHMEGASFVIGFLTGAVFTRRTGPLAGAGVLMITLAVTIWYSGAPFGDAIAGIFLLRFVSFWLPMPFSLAGLPTLRALGEAKGPQAEEEAKSEPVMDEREAG